jgi:hypothetical protein
MPEVMGLLNVSDKGGQTYDERRTALRRLKSHPSFLFYHSGLIFP